MARTIGATIDEGTVGRLAALAELVFEEEEARSLSLDLARVVDHFRTLAELDVNDVASSDEATAQPNAALLRLDIEGAELEREVLLAAAPRSEDCGFAVPTFVDEG